MRPRWSSSRSFIRKRPGWPHTGHVSARKYPCWAHSFSIVRASSLRLDLVRLLLEVGEEVAVQVREVLQHPLQDLLRFLSLGLQDERGALEVRVPKVVAGLDDLLLLLERLDQRDQEGLLPAGELHADHVVGFLDDA